MNVTFRALLLLLTFHFLLEPALVYAEEGGRCTTTALQEATPWLEEAERLLLRVEYEEALEGLNRTVARLPCLTEVPPPQWLTRAWLLLGVARRMTGDPQGAQAAFSQALAVRYDLPWDPRFGHLGLEEYEQARASVGCADCSRLRLPGLQASAHLFVDGREVLEAPTRLRLPPGSHLVQVTRAERVVWAGLVETRQGRETELEPWSPPPDASSVGPHGWLGPSVRGLLPGGLEIGGQGAVLLGSGWFLGGAVHRRYEFGLEAQGGDSSGWASSLLLGHRWERPGLIPWVGLGGEWLEGAASSRLRLAGSLGVQRRVGARGQLECAVIGAWAGGWEEASRELQVQIGWGWLLP